MNRPLNDNSPCGCNYSAFLWRLILIVLLFVSFTWGGTSGKITGRITDQATGEALVWCNIIVEGEGLGAATDLDGHYFILNVLPGTYTVKCMMIGYTSATFTNVIINARILSLGLEFKNFISEGARVLLTPICD